MGFFNSEESQGKDAIITKFAIEVRGLCKSFGNKPVLNGLDFRIPKGRVFALLGENGSGKSTIVKILSTLMEYDGGEVKILGCDPKKDKKYICERISLTGQFVAIDDGLTGEQNIILVAGLLGYNKQQAQIRAKELLKLFSLENNGKELVKEYSGGMKRRLDIAISIINIPDILFLDEPTTGLDPRSREVVWNLIRELASEGTTIFLTTQYLEEADKLAEIIAFIEGGKIVAQGSPSELKNLVGRREVKIKICNAVMMDQIRKLFGDKIFKYTSLNIKDDILSISVKGFWDAYAILKTLAENCIEPDEFSVSQASLTDLFMILTGGEGD